VLAVRGGQLQQKRSWVGAVPVLPVRIAARARMRKPAAVLRDRLQIRQAFRLVAAPMVTAMVAVVPVARAEIDAEARPAIVVVVAPAVTMTSTMPPVTVAIAAPMYLRRR